MFHLLIGNCFITRRLLIETTVGRAPKFVSIQSYASILNPFALLIELYPLVPFAPSGSVLVAHSVYIGTASAWTPMTVADHLLMESSVRRSPKFVTS